MRTEDYNYHLPEALIAQHAAEPRDAARLLQVPLRSSRQDADTAALRDSHVHDLPQILRPGDLLVLNTTKVFPARLFGHKASGGEVEILLIHPSNQQQWRCMIRGKVRVGTQIRVADAMLSVVACHDNGERDIQLPAQFDIFAFADVHGHIPLPPYIKRPDTDNDRERYQSVFAQDNGSVAAPTASLHFTTALLEQLATIGVEFAHVQLHVGPGTFKPVSEERIEDYHIHRERCICSAETVAQINTAKQQGRRVIAVGTTVTRTLETAARQEGGFAAYDDWSELFLYPPQQMQIIDGLLTNFHLPKSSLLMLVACLCGRERLLHAYQHAIDAHYRFYSYGDAMLLLP